MTKPITDVKLKDKVTDIVMEYNPGDGSNSSNLLEVSDEVFNLIKSYAKDYAEMVIGSDCQGGHDDDCEVSRQCHVENMLRQEQRRKLDNE